jgi:hypothetical protein
MYVEPEFIITRPIRTEKYECQFDDISIMEGVE